MKYPRLSRAIFKKFPHAGVPVEEIDKRLQNWSKASKWAKAEAPAFNIAGAANLAFKHRHDEGF